MPRFNKQNGATLLEAISFIAIASVVVIGAISLLSSAFSASEANAHRSELVALKVSLEGASKSINGITFTTDSVIGLGLAPDTLKINGATPTRTLTNGYGGLVDISGSIGAISIQSSSIPSEDCVKLITTINDFTRIQVDGSPAKNTPYPAGEAAADCNAGTPPNDITFIID